MESNIFVYRIAEYVTPQLVHIKTALWYLPWQNSRIAEYVTPQLVYITTALWYLPRQNSRIAEWQNRRYLSSVVIHTNWGVTYSPILLFFYSAILLFCYSAILLFCYSAILPGKVPKCSCYIY